MYRSGKRGTIGSHPFRPGSSLSNSQTPSPSVCTCAARHAVPAVVFLRLVLKLSRLVGSAFWAVGNGCLETQIHTSTYLDWLLE